MKTTIISTTWISRGIAGFIASVILFGVYSILSSQHVAALECVNISYSDHYCQSGIDTSDIIFPGNYLNVKRDPRKRIELIKRLRAEKGMLGYSSNLVPANILAEEIEILEELGGTTVQNIKFLKTMHDLMEDKPHQAQLKIVLNITRALKNKSSSELASLGLNKEDIAEVLYYVVLKYLVYRF